MTTREMPEYNSWRAIVQRCTNPAHRSFARYGGRGVSMSPKWRASFEAFLADVGPRPARGDTLDRIDNARGYEPGNVRWASQTEQQRNRTNNRLMTLHGETMPLAAWAERIGLKKCTLLTRLHLGWTDERALTAPLRSALTKGSDR